ncbi:MAG: substrate-binding domain-containing protein [Nitrospinae bacterium]|nr:substrate-binding domain-containing protein [Nitrospinota bacterium]
MIPAVGICHAGQIVVILNKNNNVAHLSIDDLQSIFEGRKKSWDGGETVVLILPPPKSEAMNTLAAKVFKKSDPADVARFYLKAIFQQVFVYPPKSAGTTEKAVAEVSQNEGAIAVVDAGEIDDKKSVRIIKVNGL